MRDYLYFAQQVGKPLRKMFFAANQPTFLKNRDESILCRFQIVVVEDQHEREARRIAAREDWRMCVEIVQ